MKLPLRFLLICCSIVLLGMMSTRALADDGINVESSDARSAFPDGIKFTLTASSAAKITQVRLRYQLMPSKIESLVRAECEGEMHVTCSISIGGAAGQVGYVVPFAEVRYGWELADAAGNATTTQPRSAFYDDVRFKWSTVVDGNLTLYYYTGTEAEARAALVAGRDAIDKHSALLGTKVDFPVRVVEYANTRDLEEASTRGRRGGGNIVLAGQMVADDTVISTRDSVTAGTDRLDILRHELSHVVTGFAVRDGGIDSWINEGLGMYAERVLDRGYVRLLERAVRGDNVYPIVSMNSTSVRQNDPDLFYAQAHSMVKFLIESQGQPKFREFIAALNGKQNTNEAMQGVYGFNKEGFEDLWRKSVGLPPIAAPTAGQPANAAAATLNIEPMSNPVASGASSKDRGGSSALPIVGVVVAAIVVLGGAGAVVLCRKRA